MQGWPWYCSPHLFPLLFFYAFFPLNQPSWRQIHERSEKIYYPRHWRYQYFSYNKSSPNSLNCVHYLIMTKKEKALRHTSGWWPPQIPFLSSLGISEWHSADKRVCMKCCHQALIQQHKRWHTASSILSVHVPTPNARHIRGNTSWESSFCWHVFPPLRLNISIRLSLYPEKGDSSWQHETHTHTHAMLC